LALEFVATADMGAAGRRRATPLPSAGRAASCGGDAGAGAGVEATDPAGWPVEALVFVRRDRGAVTREGHGT